MKLLGTVKGKIIAGVAAVGVLSSAGVAFANTGAGDALKEWYDGMFNETVDAAMGEAEAYADGQIPAFNEQYNDWKDHSAGIIDRSRIKETNDSIDGIEAAKDSHIEDVEGTKEDIMENMQFEFYNVFVEGVAEINRVGDEALDYVNTDMNAFAETEGEAAKAQITDDLTTAKEDAVTDLEDAIEAAKGELSDELDNQGETLTGNFETRIDLKISEILSHVSDTLDELVEEQQTIIAEHAQGLEDDAKDALDDVVAGINE